MGRRDSRIAQSGMELETEMTWTDRVERVLLRVQTEHKVFINPRKQAQDYQAALESVGKGLLRFDGCYFYAQD